MSTQRDDSGRSARAWLNACASRSPLSPSALVAAECCFLHRISLFFRLRSFSFSCFSLFCSICEGTTEEEDTEEEDTEENRDEGLGNADTREGGKDEEEGNAAEA